MKQAKWMAIILSFVFPLVLFTGCPNPGDSAWHEIGTSGEPAFSGTWTNAGGAYSTTAFRIDGMGFVHLKGVLANGATGTMIFTLPAGYRPNLMLMFGDGLNNFVTIHSDGGVWGIYNNTFNRLYLDGITFYAEQ